jgi:dienelactone hydrolase
MRVSLIHIFINRDTGVRRAIHVMMSGIFNQSLARNALSMGVLMAAPALAQAPPPAAMAAVLDETLVTIPSGGMKLVGTQYKPPGNGPFPLFVMNHGKAAGNAHADPRARYFAIASEFVRRGYVVVLPNRKGVAGSEGLYIGSDCHVKGTGDIQADDVVATLNWATKLPFVDATRIVVGGQSHGGMTTLAFGARDAYPGVKALINWAGGSRNERCPGWEGNMARSFGDWGKTNRYPTLWFYGENESFFPPKVYKPAHEAYVAAGGNAKLVEFGVFAHGDAHAMSGNWNGIPIWLPHVKSLLESVGLPFSVTHMTSDSPLPAATNGNVTNVDAVPRLSDNGKANYRKYLEQPGVRAFALSVSSGRHGWAWGMLDPASAALRNCQQTGETCKLYSLNETVVWDAKP